MPLHIDHEPFGVVRPALIEDEGEGDVRQFYISKSALAKILASGLLWKYANAELIEQVLLSPCSIFNGLNRQDYQNGLCYVADLPHRYDEYGDLEKMPDDRLFLIFVKRYIGLVVFDWEFRERDAINPNFPLNHENDFGGVAWERSA